MAERTVLLQIDQAYAELKKSLLKGKCKIAIENPPQSIVAKQGSLNGITPKSAKKVITFQLTQELSGTKITSVTKIARDWTKLTVYGNILAAIVIVMFLWIATDIENYVFTTNPSYWSWLAPAFGMPDATYTLYMVNITRALAFFLIAAIAAEILIVLYVYPRKNIYAHQTLQTLQSPQGTNANGQAS